MEKKIVFRALSVFWVYISEIDFCQHKYAVVLQFGNKKDRNNWEKSRSIFFYRWGSIYYPYTKLVLTINQGADYRFSREFLRRVLKEFYKNRNQSNLT